MDQRSVVPNSAREWIPGEALPSTTSLSVVHPMVAFSATTLLSIKPLIRGKGIRSKASCELRLRYFFWSG